MKTKIVLRIASIIMLLHTAGHFIGHMNWKHPVEPEKQAIIDQMNGKAFPFMGAVHSIGDFYEGFGHASTIAMLFIVALLWLVSSDGERDPKYSSKIVLLAAICLFFWGVNEVIYFFAFAASFSFASCALCLYAYLQLKKSAA